ncbi:RcnB family protein [Bosea robiniae]|jgi:Ni/Co efflux regulator RcnB|uniref:Regulator RcnB of Ni and Co efflux n=1 Tax=Bosea robiniae TaxID=1036780 RepID=A0ABY0NQL6_9HYPH|nr:RcnB family protein [Bosea robiniae]SDF93954.1 regulator RcnB of Ni and Co efflux [Bosea robiniae]
MKKIIASAIAGAFLLGATAPSFAQSYRAQHHGPARHGPVHVEKHVTKKVIVRKDRWARGHALPRQYRQSYVRDYHRYHLRAPGRGQRWVRVDNQFILINSITGMIAALAAAR